MTSNQTELNQEFMFAEYQEFVKTRPSEMGNYLMKKMPFPDRTERFNWEDYEDGSPLLLKIRSWGSIWRSHLIAKCQSAAWLGVLIGLALNYWGEVSLLLSIPIVIILLLAVIGIGGSIGLSIYRRNVKLVESDNVRDDVFQRNFTRWAVTRYDFTSEEDFFIMLKGKDGTRCYLAEGGPLSGLLISSATGNEWPLKPNNV